MISHDSGSVTKFKYKFLNIKVKRQSYEGKSAIVIFIHDVSKKINSKIIELQQQEKIIQARQTATFTSTLSHEMRTPLGSVLFFV